VIQKLNHFRAMASFVNINGAVLAYEISSDEPLLITLHGGRGFGM
jgi:hypothetical protein